MIAKSQIEHVRTEHDFLANADNRWIVSLKYSFQDSLYLYLAMEYLPGGDLMQLLIRRRTLTEDEARFYAAEMIMAIDAVH